MPLPNTRRNQQRAYVPSRAPRLGKGEASRPRPFARTSTLITLRHLEPHTRAFAVLTIIEKLDARLVESARQLGERRGKHASAPAFEIRKRSIGNAAFLRQAPARPSEQSPRRADL